MEIRQRRTEIRVYRGGIVRGVSYAIRRGIPLTLQMIVIIIMLPISPLKKLKKIQRLSYQLLELVKGLWHFNSRLESSDK